MHRLPSVHAIRRIRLTAVMLVAKCLLGPATLVVLAVSVVTADAEVAWIGLALGGATLLVTGLQRLLAARACCPLCITPVMATKGCAKHRNAKTFLGDYPLRVALSALCTGRFRCPYCGEPTVLQVRQSREP